LTTTTTATNTDRELAQQVTATHKALTEDAIHMWNEHRTLGSELIYCQMAKRPDGTDVLLSALVQNPHGEAIAQLAPLDPESKMWSRRTIARTLELTSHPTLSEAYWRACQEAAHRGAWNASTYDDVLDAYLSNPRPACQACGR